MKICELLFKFYIFVILLKISFSALSTIPENLITSVKISEFKNMSYTGESEIFTNENYPSIKFFKIDFSSLKDLSEENHFSFIKLTASVKPETTYKSLYLNVNKTLYDSQCKA